MEIATLLHHRINQSPLEAERECGVAILTNVIFALFQTDQQVIGNDRALLCT
jgi:hypothetical protein